MNNPTTLIDPSGLQGEGGPEGCPYFNPNCESGGLGGAPGSGPQPCSLVRLGFVQPDARPCGSGGGGGGGGSGPISLPPPKPSNLLLWVPPAYNPCGSVPQSLFGPSGASVNTNIATTIGVQVATSTIPTATGTIQLPGAAFAWWLYQVRPGGPWDYAGNYGRTMSNSSFGNFNYGATCAAMGFTLQTCQRGAGAEDYFMGAENYAAGRGWSAGPGNPFTGNPVVVNGLPDYGDQTNWAENPSVISGWTYGSGGCPW